MTAAFLPGPPDDTPAALHEAFLALLPRLQLHGRVYFRGVRCPTRKEDLIAEMVALAWLWFVRLARRGKDPAAFPSAIATYAARAVHYGRRVCGQERAKDVLSPLAQRRHGFRVSRLPSGSGLVGNLFDEALAMNTVSPVPEQVCFRLDFPAWMARHSERNRRILLDLMAGERTLDVARKHGTSPARVSQLRREFLADWRRFCGD
jgi:hypothetical protein